MIKSDKLLTFTAPPTTKAYSVCYNSLSNEFIACITTWNSDDRSAQGFVKALEESLLEMKRIIDFGGATSRHTERSDCVNREETSS